MQIAITYVPDRRPNWHAAGRHIRARLTRTNVLRVALASLALIAIPFDVERRVLGPAPNWPLIATEPVVLIAYLRCTLGPMIR